MQMHWAFPATPPSPPVHPVRDKCGADWRLEAAGYETEVVEFVAPTITPHNLLWRARLVREPRRMAAAKIAWENLMAAR